MVLKQFRRCIRFQEIDCLADAADRPAEHLGAGIGGGAQPIEPVAVAAGDGHGQRRRRGRGEVEQDPRGEAAASEDQDIDRIRHRRRLLFRNPLLSSPARRRNVGRSIRSIRVARCPNSS
jgi:hypothetical protein